jgi:hemerythrin-like domain-containing protein
LLQHGSDDQARTAASNIMRYFESSALHHHQDEEQDLFPALLESMAGSDAVCIKALTQGLADEHRKLERGWRNLKPWLERIAAGEPATLPADAVTQFVDLYAQHIQREEDELLPMAARLLGDADIDSIGRAMRQRRGIPDSAL